MSTALAPAVAHLPRSSLSTGFASYQPDSLGGKVPDPDENMPDGERRYQIYLKSPAGPIDVYVVSQARSRRHTTETPRDATAVVATDYHYALLWAAIPIR